MQKGNTVVVFSSSSDIEIERASQYLESKKITCVVQRNVAQDLGIGSVFGLKNSLLGNMNILVLESKAVLALKYIDEIIPKTKGINKNAEKDSMALPDYYKYLRLVCFASFALPIIFRIIAHYIAIPFGLYVFIGLGTAASSLNIVVGYKFQKSLYILLGIGIACFFIYTILTIFI